MKFFDAIIDSINEGIIAIDGDGAIKCYNSKAKALFGITNKQGIGHEAGRLEAGDIVVIADSAMGQDDGGLTEGDLTLIGLKGAVIPKDSAFAAIGIMGGTASTACLTVLQNAAIEKRIELKQQLHGHAITAEVDLWQNRALISVDGESFTYSFIKNVGYMVIISKATGKVKFYQTLGYTARREDIRNILYGKSYLQKGEGAIEMDVIGKNIFDVHPRERNINIIEFLEAAKGKNISYQNEVREFNGRPTRCALISVKEGGKTLGAILKVEDITELKSAIDERDYAIATLNAVESQLKGAAPKAFDEIIGQSESIKTVKRLAKKAAETDSTVLLLGESGTGKGLIAECIHQYGKKKKGRFVYVNCASIPETLLESELFGYEGGSFTGAKKDGKPGLFELANGGTIFLDEIGDIPVFLQVKLLHVLQSKQLRRVGGNKDIEVNTKIITATNRDLEAAVAEGSFRKDLYYRINVFPIYIPPLRLRQEDIFPLIHALLPKICARVGCGEKRISGEAIRLMTAYAWPGNVRELENILERAVNVAEGSTVLKEHLNLKIDHQESAKRYNGEVLSEVLEQVEKETIKEALSLTKGNKAEAMKLLGMGKTRFYEKLKKYGI